MTMEFDYTEMQHEVGTINISPAFLGEIEDFQVNDGLRDAILADLADMARRTRPNANYFATIKVDILARTMPHTLGVLCLPRAFRPKPDERVKWGVAIVTEAQYDELLSLPQDEINSRLVGFLALDGEAARYWTKRY